MTKYKLVTGFGNLIGNFESHIQDLIKQGWKLQGGISVTQDRKYNDIMFTQAMTKEVANDDSQN